MINHPTCRRYVWTFCLVAATTVYCVAGLLVFSPLSAQSDGDESFDSVLNLYVRDGFVDYSSLLRVDRAVVDRYVDGRSSSPADFGVWSPARQMAFWLNSYNALVVQTVLDHYPIRGHSPEYPSNSIRQIPGAFARRTHRVAGHDMTLDSLEQGVLAAFGDPRVFLALGRGALGSGRLRSEVYEEMRLDQQLTAAVEEFATEPWGVELDQRTQSLRMNEIIGWRSEQFIDHYADRGWLESGRAPIERAIINLIEPVLYPSEQAFLAENLFSVSYQPFDWNLNDRSSR